MTCRRFQRDVARYRELNPSERQALEGHLRTCPKCRRALAAYARQDALLSTLGALQPSPAWARGVLLRVRAQRERRRPAHSMRRLAPVLASLALVLLFASTMAVSASALPGQPLYALKRTQEELRLRLLPEGTPRAEYAQALAERRREEAQRLLQTGRTAEVTFEGPLEAVRGAWWRVGGVEVQVPGNVRPDPPPALGERVFIRARIQGGHAVALSISCPSFTPTPQGGTPQPTMVERTPSPTNRPPEAIPTSPKPSPMPQGPAYGAPTPRKAEPTLAPTFVPPGQWGKTPQPTAPSLPTPTARPSPSQGGDKNSPGGQSPGGGPNGAPHSRK